MNAYPEFYVEMKDENETEQESESHETSDWSIGGSAEFDVEVKAGVEVGDLAEAELSIGSKTSLSYNYDRHSDEWEYEKHTRQTSFSSQTNYNDVLYYQYQLFDIWRYPVYNMRTRDEDKPYAIMEYIIPGPLEKNYGGDKHPWYQPFHQNHNLLTYPPKDDSFPSDVGEFTFPNNAGKGTTVKLLLNEEAVYHLNGNSTTLSLNWTEESGGGSERTWNHTLSESEEIKIGYTKKVLGKETEVGARFTFHNSNTWGGKTVNKNKSSKTKGFSIVKPTGHFTTDWEFAFKPAVYFSSHGGMMRVSHAVDFDASRNEGINWDRYYGLRPDPALNLPYKFDHHKSESHEYDVWELIESTDRMRMGGFFMEYEDLNPITGQHDVIAAGPKDGDRVRLTARIYNLSFKDVAPFKVAFQYVLIDSALKEEVGERIPIDVYQLGSTMRPLEIRPVTVVWDTTGLSNPIDPETGAVNQNLHYRFYVIVDPLNEIDNEVHEWSSENGDILIHGNNEGYWPQGNNGVRVYPKQDNQTKTRLKIQTVPEPHEVHLHEESVAIKTESGLQTVSPVHIQYNKSYWLRAHIQSNFPVRDIKHIVFHEGHPHENGKVIGSEIAYGLVGDDYVWMDWRPDAPGIYELWVQILEDSTDPEPGNHIDHLVVIVEGDDTNIEKWEEH